MLRVHTDRGGSYLDYLRPFVLQSLIDHRPEPVTDSEVRRLILADFGLSIPGRTIQLVLKRLSRRNRISKRDGVYHIDGALPDPGIARKRASARRHIDSIVERLRRYASETGHPDMTSEEAEAAIEAFLSKFDVLSLKAYLRGTVLPELSDAGRAGAAVLVGGFVVQLLESDPAGFDSFLVMVTGHMLANALLCPDLDEAPKSFARVTFYFDTPVVICLLGLDGAAKREASEAFVALLAKLGARLAVFEHSVDEIERVVRAAARHLKDHKARSAIVAECRRSGTTESDLLLLITQLEELLSNAGLHVEATPRYILDYQIDEVVFEDFLDHDISYFNPRAREFDINSVRSVYTLRGKRRIKNIETAGAVLVTSNADLAHAAFVYGERVEGGEAVPSVVTDFALANIAWLKAPMEVPSVPRLELLATAYGALNPSPGLMDKYLREIERLERLDRISPRDHQLLRSSEIARTELMRLTLGEERALTEETVTATLERVTADLAVEERARLSTEQAAHAATAASLEALRCRHEAMLASVVSGVNASADRAARVLAWTAFALGLVGLLWVTFGEGVRWPYWLVLVVAGVFLVSSVYSLADLIFDLRWRSFRSLIRHWVFNFLLARQAKRLGLDLGELREGSIVPLPAVQPGGIVAARSARRSVR